MPLLVAVIVFGVEVAILVKSDRFILSLYLEIFISIL